MQPSGAFARQPRRREDGLKVPVRCLPVLSAVFVYGSVVVLVRELWKQRRESAEASVVPAASAAVGLDPAGGGVVVGPGDLQQVASSTLRLSAAGAAGAGAAGGGGVSGQAEAAALALRLQEASRRPVDVSGRWLRAAWSFLALSAGTTAGRDEATSASEARLSAGGLEPSALGLRGTGARDGGAGADLLQRDAFELWLSDGSRVRARDCRLATRQPMSAAELLAGTADNAAARAALGPLQTSGEALTLRCPYGLEVQWAVGLLQLTTGAEVLRVRLLFDHAAGSAVDGAFPEVARLTMWSLGVKMCADGAASAAPSSCFSSGIASTPSRSIAGAGNASATGPGASATPPRALGVVHGSPLLGLGAGAWLAMEHPRATAVSGPRALVGLDSPEPRTAYFASLGVLPSADGLDSAGTLSATEDSFFLLRRHFHSYLDLIRASPYRTNLHYTTWYDLRNVPCRDSSALGRPACHAADVLSRSVVEGRFATLHRELVERRGVPLNAVLLDDGWDAEAEAPWRVNTKTFPNGLAPLSALVAERGSAVGVWLSPWGGFQEAGKRRLERAAALHGLEVSNASGGGRMLRLAEPRCYSWFLNVTRELALVNGVRQFKFDGFGGGLAASGAHRSTGADADALLRLAASLRRDVASASRGSGAAAAAEGPLWVSASTGSWPSPFWLMAADVVWRDGPDLGREGAAGSARQQWITFRDATVYRRVVLRAPMFPLSALSLGGIIWSRAEEPGTYLDSFDMADFRDEVRSFFLSGAASQELLVQPNLFTAAHWDVIADAANVSRSYRAVLQDSHWIGGDPAEGLPYGYGAFACPPCVGLLSLRNPLATPQDFSVTLRRALALPSAWPGGAASSRWRIEPLWKDEASLSGAAAPAALSPGAAPLFWPRIGLDEPLSLTLQGLQLLALRVTVAA